MFVKPTLAAIAVFLTSTTAVAPVGGLNVTEPDAFQFGEGVAAHDFETLCEGHEVRELDPGQLPLAKKRHVQVDCRGFAWLGGRRLAEFVFADGRLSHVWVLTNAKDLASIRLAFEAEYGEPSHDIGGLVTAWVAARVAIRYDVPEAIYISKAAAPFFAEWFDQAAGR